MRSLLASILTVAALAAPDARAACAPLRFGYPDQAVEPYYRGSGRQEADPPGASVELMRALAASAGCPLESVRLPAARLLLSLNNGVIDATPFSIGELQGGNIVYPRDKKGKIDRNRGLTLYTVVFVRASDNVGRDVDTASYLRGRRLGVLHGVPYAATFRQAGYEVDDGARDVHSNVEKLRLGRIDGFAISLAGRADLDGEIAASFGGAIVRLEQPLRVGTIWLLLNKDYYEHNREAAEAMWTWLGEHGQSRFTALLKKYDKAP
ncbi:hypothetical protein H3H36_07545 [Duganella sp. FT3S]|uniref:Transporter substrate-binding domain-containing protein n=1 Tax=Rugamonas fusca TaxID=2758568 RepID=A0A7W2EFV9_9BURK|nr:hypothetical protein [Rugamonas fusca]MBA5605212.1 hypothetical protein [Rugamonas fusca]